MRKASWLSVIFVVLTWPGAGVAAAEEPAAANEKGTPAKAAGAAASDAKVAIRGNAQCA